MVSEYPNGAEMYSLAKELFPLNRSLTGEGINKSYEIINKVHEEFDYLTFSSGEKVFDWEIPLQWDVLDAYIEHESGEKFCDIKENNLHLIGYSEPVDLILKKKDLISKIKFLKDYPDAIPYSTTYYKKDWGFCISYNQYLKLPDGNYRCYINSSLKPGQMKVMEILIPGHSEKEIFLSSYLCHPSMANNELSGPVLISEILKYIKKLKNRKYSYRCVLLPETIGSIAYLSRRLEILKKNVICGFNVSCCGDDRRFTHLQSRKGNTLADQSLAAALLGRGNVHTKSFLERGSDERQYNSPGVDLPLCGFSKSKWDDYPEYHTSLDNLELISEKGLQESFDVIKTIIDSFEVGFLPKATNFCEPQLGKRGLYNSSDWVSFSKDQKENLRKSLLNLRFDLLAYADGETNIFEICKLINFKLEDIVREVKILKENSLLTEKNIY